MFEITEEIESTYFDAWKYLKDRYNITHSFSTFKKNQAARKFGKEDFDLIVMTVLVSSGYYEAAFEEANTLSNETTELLGQSFDKQAEEIVQLEEYLNSYKTENKVLLETLKIERADSNQIIEDYKKKIKELDSTIVRVNDLNGDNMEMIRENSIRIVKANSKYNTLKELHEVDKQQLVLLHQEIEELKKPWYLKIFKKMKL